MIPLPWAVVSSVDSRVVSFFFDCERQASGMTKTEPGLHDLGVSLDFIIPSWSFLRTIRGCDRRESF
jgi:hypothetical protein